MYEPVKFKRLNELVKELSEKISKLHIGQLSKSELEGMTEESRELYERLVVLRFKAFQDEVGEGNSDSILREQAVMDSRTSDKEEVEASIPFRIHGSEKVESVSQVSLIDAIEEVTKESCQLPVEPDMHSSPLMTIQSSSEPTQGTVNERMSEGAKENFYDKLSKTVEQKESLNAKLEHYPIPDLKRAISLNQRFQFSKELFKGNNQEYEVAIDRLNTTTKDEAMKQLESLGKKYEWNLSSALATDFMVLVERRYL